MTLRGVDVAAVTEGRGGEGREGRGGEWSGIECAAVSEFLLLGPSLGSALWASDSQREERSQTNKTKKKKQRKNESHHKHACSDQKNRYMK